MLSLSYLQLKSVCVGGLVTSLQLMNDNKSILVGTIKCEMLLIDLDTFAVHLYLTCHTTAVYDIAFPRYLAITLEIKMVLS